MVHPLDVGITRSLIGFCVLLQMCVLPLRAQDSELPVDAGRIVHARPWRTPDRRVQVDFIVQFDELRVFPGMVLSAWRATRAGELEALPEVRVGLFVARGRHCTGVPIFDARGDPCGRSGHPGR